jgi:hypothetical protein
MSDATVTRRYGPYEEGQRISDRSGVEGSTFVDPARFARLVAEGHAAADVPPEPPPPPATPKLNVSNRRGRGKQAGG